MHNKIKLYWIIIGNAPGCKFGTRGPAATVNKLPVFAHHICIKQLVQPQSTDNIVAHKINVISDMNDTILPETTS